MKSAFKALTKFVLLALFASGCAHRAARTGGESPHTVSEPSPETHVLVPAAKPLKPASPRCGRFCDQIRQCATQAGHHDLSELLCGIARCETGDKCVAKISSPGGRYRGAFQFSPQTWRSQCGQIFVKKGLTGCLNRKSMSDLCCATACSAELIARGGIENWPACSKKVAEIP